MDANAKLDRIVVGLRSGLIVMFNLTYDQEQVVNVDEVELGVSIKLSNLYIFSFIRVRFLLLKSRGMAFMAYLEEWTST